VGQKRAFGMAVTIVNLQKRNQRCRRTSARSAAVVESKRV
jgi:hypothetical protein